MQSAPVIREKLAVEKHRFQANSLQKKLATSIVLRSGSLPAPIEIEKNELPVLVKIPLSKALSRCCLASGLGLYDGLLPARRCLRCSRLGLQPLTIIVALVGRCHLNVARHGRIVLTTGMAVDANVLIFQRIREELAKSNNAARSTGV